MVTYSPLSLFSTLNVLSVSFNVIGPKIRKEFKKVNKDITFTSGKNLRSILCQNKPKLLPNSHPGVYQLDCSCNGRYIGESKKKVLTR